MSIEKKIFAVNICYCKHDLQKRWFVKVKVPHFTKGIFVWKKCYGDINKYNTIQERTQAAENLKAHIILTQNYIVVQGSRNVGYTYEGFVTDTIYQLQRQQKIREQTIRRTTAQKYRGCLRNMERWLISTGNTKLPIGAFSMEHVQLFLSHIKNIIGLSNSAYNAHLTLFKSLFEQMIEQKIITLNPWVSCKTLSKNSVPSLYFSNTQIGELKNEISSTDVLLWRFVQFIYYCFIRPNEIRHLKIADIQLQNARIEIRGSFSKNKKTQWVSLPAQMIQLISSMNLHKYPPHYYIFGKQNAPGETMLGINNMRLRHVTVLERLGYSKRHVLYSWKHTGAIACTKAGMNLKDLQMQLRHHSLDQVNQYLADMMVFESDFIKNQFPSL